MHSNGGYASQVFHNWAHQTKPSGRRGDGRVFFEGPALYSFGTHYVAGYVMPGGSILLNATRYSPTTSGHVSAASSSAPGEIYRVPDLTELVHSGALSPDTPKVEQLAQVKGHIKANWQAYAAPESDWYCRECGRAGVQLLTWAGCKDAKSTFDALIRRERAAHDRIEAKAEKAVRARLLKQATWIAEASETVKAARLAELAGRGESALRAHASELFSIHRAASAAGRKSKAAVWAWRKRFLAEADRQKHLAEMRRARQSMRGYVAAVRNAIAAAGDDAPGSYLFQLGERAAGYVHSYAKGATPRLKTSLKTLADDFHARHASELARENAEAEERRARESAERFERDKANRRAWLAGEPTPGVYGLSDERGGALIRAVDVERDFDPEHPEKTTISGGTLQTSHGVDVPLVHALKVFAFVRRVVASGETWYANGHTIKVGYYRVEWINPEGTMRAGCHTIHLAEMERLAGVLDVFATPQTLPSDAALEPSRGAA
jgi:cytochrome c556